MNKIKATDEDIMGQVINGTPIVPFDKSKKLVSLDGKTELFYIETETAYTLKIDSKIDFTQKHPQDSRYHLITIPIDRV